MARFVSGSFALWICVVAAARDVRGTISSTLTITEDSQLVGDVTCALSGAPCIQINASSVTLKLNGFTITGEADPETACGGGQITESGAISAIMVAGQTDVTIEGPGVIRRSRGFGIVIGTNSGCADEGHAIAATVLRHWSGLGNPPGRLT
jgi:hypothetical protein